ncbi:hypothetical protein QTP70_020471 [Hemibagrus guttatus]|uniref:Venom protein n=1 Tax=Hemibagrus guttatus TaxID=175788 RepID=A0AAE0VBA5_9TELE|nr:hypothetical protein QTP70_020471 [Hemibagrus guttatus]
MFTVIFMCLWLSLGDSMADSIKPLFTHKFVDEGDEVTLSCMNQVLQQTTTCTDTSNIRNLILSTFFIFTKMEIQNLTPQECLLKLKINKWI